MYIPARRSKPEDQQDGGPVDAIEQEFDGLFVEEEEVPNFLRTRSNIERLQRASATYSDRAVDILRKISTAYYKSDVIEREVLRAVIHENRRRLVGCVTLPFSIMFFLMFALSAYLHEDISNVYVIETGLREVLGAGLDSVGDIPGVWEWIQHTTLTPTLFNQNASDGRPLSNKTFWSRVLTYNQMQGPMLLSQMRSKKERCNDGEGIIGDMMCYPQATRSREEIEGRPGFTPAVQVPQVGEYSSRTVSLEERLAYYNRSFSVTTAANSRRLRIMRQEYMGRLPGGSGTDDDVYQAFFYPNTPYHKIQEHLEFLRDKGWLDTQSKELAVNALLLNAEVGRPRLEQLRILFRFSRGGGVFARLTLESLFLKFWDTNMTLFIDVVTVVMLLVITCVEVMELVRAFRGGRCRAAFKRFWTILQWFIIVLGWAVIFGYVIQDGMRKQVVDALRDVISLQVGDSPAEENKLGGELHRNADTMIFFTTWFRILVAEYHLVLMFRFFTAFNAQPRLGVVTRTLEASMVDILHFLIVLLPTFIAYSISGLFIFGRRMEEFATLDGAVGVCFKMVMEGEYDWQQLSQEHYWTAAFWVWTFMLLLVLLMLNMVLAIVMDVYREMRSASGHSETVWMTLKNFATRLRWFRSWKSNTQLERCLEKMPAEFSLSELQDALPGMCDQQLEILTTACKFKVEQDSIGFMDLQSSIKMAMAVKLVVDRVIADISKISEEAMATASGQHHIMADDLYKPEPSCKLNWLQETARQMAAQNHWMVQAQWQLQQLQWRWQALEAVHGPDLKFPLKGTKASNDKTDVVL